MHCTDEDLLAYLDGELNPISKLRVHVHLKRCWECRTQLASCEQEIQRLTKGIRDWVDPGPAWMLDSKWRLARGMQRVEAALPYTGTFRPGSLRKALWIAAAASCSLLVIAGLLSPLSSRQSTAPAALEAVSRAAAIEEQLFRDPVQQDVTVEIEETRPKRVSRRGRVQATSDRMTGRFATNWGTSDGASKLALWRPSAETIFEWAPARQGPLLLRKTTEEDAVTLPSLADGGLDPEAMEGMFLRWLASRAWRPISFSSDLSVWARQDGTVMKVERFQDDGRAPTVRITAQRTDRRRVLAVVTLELDAETFRPRLQKLRFETTDSEVELRLVSMETRVLRRADLRDSVFRPPASLEAKEPAASAASSWRYAPAVAAPDLAKAETAAQAAEKIAGEVRAHFALHRAGACVGAPVEIFESAAGVMVRRRNPESGEVAEIAAVGSSLADVLGVLADLRTQQAHQGPMQGALPAIGNSEQIGALEALAERFPTPSIGLMDATTRRLFDQMIQSHRGSISAELSPAERRRVERLDGEFHERNSGAITAAQK